MNQRRTLNSLAKWFFLCALTLSLLGLLFIYSSSSVYAMERHGVAHYFVIKQCWHLLLSLLAAVVATYVPLTWLMRGALPLFLITAMGTFLTGSWGVSIHGATRWVFIAGHSIQPSELLSVATLIFTAAYLAKQHHLGYHLFTWRTLPFAAMLGLACTLLLKQPDFGCMVTLMGTVAVLFFVAGVPWREFAILVAGALPVLGVLLWTQPYRLARVMTYLNPWADPQGRGFQIIQSLLAIGAGRIWGLGIGQSRQKFFYLPMQHTDFIFSIIAEETGFFGSLIIILLCLAFVTLGFKLALRVSNSFGSYLILASTTFLALKALINIMVCTGLVPTKGLGLPFVSYGGSALIAAWIGVGLVLNVVRGELSLR